MAGRVRGVLSMPIVKKCHRCFRKAVDGSNYCEKHLDSERKRIKEYNFRNSNNEELIKYNKFYASGKWQSLREYIKVKYFGMCLLCWGKNNVIDSNTVHHIIETNTEEGWERRLDETNCVPVCRSCHEHIHNEYIKSITSKKKMQKKLFKLRSEFLCKYSKE